MTTPFRKGAKVRQNVKPICGEVVGFSIDPETGERQFMVEYPDPLDTEGDGDYKHQRYFKETDLELDPDADQPGSANAKSAK